MDNTYLIAAGVITALAIFVWLNFLSSRNRYLKSEVNETIKDLVILRIAVPQKNIKRPVATEQLFQSLHGILRNQSKSTDHFSFEIIGTNHGIHFIVACSQRYKKFVENQIYAQYPEAQITQVHDYTKSVFQPNSKILSSELVLQKDYFLPLKTFQSFEVDPLASITAALSKMDFNSEVWVQILARPINNDWQIVGNTYIADIRNKRDENGRKIDYEPGQRNEISEIEKKSTKLGFQFLIRIVSRSDDELMAAQALEDVEASFKQFQSALYNGLVQKREVKTLDTKIKQSFFGKKTGDKLDPTHKYINRYLAEDEPSIVNTEELASIYHLPNDSVRTPNIVWVRSKKLDIPQDLPFQDARLFAVTDYRSTHIPFGIKKEDRRRHMYILGKSGTGKTTMLKNLIAGDIIDGQGFAFIDPHGDAVEEILDLIPPNRIKDVIYLDPSDKDFPIGINMLDIQEGESMELLADGIVSVFKRFFENSWGPRLQYLLTNSLLTLLHCQNVSLLALQRLLVDRNYRKFLLKQVKDPFLLKFWETEYEAMSLNKSFIAEAISPIQNKVGRFLSSPMVRNMFGQVKSNINLQDAMNSGKILLVNLSQGKIGEENSFLLGGMLVTRLYSNAMQRAKIPETERRDFYLYVDEFQNFATDAFSKILSEARKYGLSLVVTHQYIDQLPNYVQDAIFGNIGTMMNYVVGQKDAHRLEREYTPFLNSEDLVNLEKHRLTLKLMIDGSQSAPFTAIALPPSYNKFNLKQQVKDFSRQTYSTPAAEVEAKLNKWALQEYDDRGNLVQKKNGEWEQKNEVRE